MSKNKMIVSLCLSLFLVPSAFATSSLAADVELLGNVAVHGTISSTNGFTFPYGATSSAPGLSFIFDRGFVVDNSGANTGDLMSGAIKFGAGSGATGEGIASTRQPGHPNQDGLDFYTNSTARLSIANNGYVGIGTRTPDFPLTVSTSKSYGHARFGDSQPTYIGSNNSWIGSNLYWDIPAGSWKYGTAGIGGLIWLSSAGLSFGTAPSGTGGSNAAVTWGMNLVNGKLRVGDMSVPTEALDVTGNIKASGTVNATSFSGNGAGLTNVITSAQTKSGATTPILSTCTNYSAGNVSVTAPSAGVIMVDADVSLNISHAINTEDRAFIYIGSSAADCTDDSDFTYMMTGVPAPYPTSTNYQTVHVMRRYTVNAAGTYTYYLNGISASGTINFWYANMRALFYAMPQVIIN